MIDEKFFLRLPKFFKNKIKIYPPLVKEVVENEDFGQYIFLLTITQEELEDENKKKKNIDSNENIPTPFEFLLATSYQDKRIEKIAKDAFYFFLKTPVTFMYDIKKILIGNIEDVAKEITSVEDLNKLTFIDEEDYFDFQNAIREALGSKAMEPPNPDEDPRVKRIKAKARYRDKIKAKKGMGISFSTTLVSICCMGIGITPLNIGELSYASVGYIMRMYQEKEKYELDINSILAGADSKKIKPKYWIRNLDD